MKIQAEEFGYNVARTAPQPDVQQVGESIARGARQVSAALDNYNQRKQALQRAKAATKSVGYQSQVEDAARGVEQDINAGKIDYEKAGEEFDKRVGEIKKPDTQFDDPTDAENQERYYSIAQSQSRRSLDPVVASARVRDGAAQFATFIDTQAKRAVEPGANIDSINASIDAFGQNARAYGLSQNLVENGVREAKDANWFNSATQRAVNADGNLGQLHALLHDVTNPQGIYAEKLDPTKRNALQASIQNQIDRIELRAQAAADRADAHAGRTIVTIERQISSGIPATPEMWADWANTVKGSEFEQDFNDLVQSEQEVQTVLRQPLADQVRLVQEKEAALYKGGGTVAQGANVNRLKNAVESNVKLLTQNPLVFGEERLGDKNELLDLGSLLKPEEQDHAAAVIQERATRVRALSKQFQAPIPMRPLLPQEASGLASALEKASPAQAAELYGSLAEVASTPEVYRGIMQQIAPDVPVRAMAGLLAQQQRDLVTSSHWYKPDEKVASRDVAATMLEGDRLLNRSSTARAEDGKAQTKLVLPETKILQTEFAKQVGTAFAGRPQAAELAFQATQAYYAGRVAQTGKIAADTQDVDKDLVRESVTATIGNVVDINGRGEVVAPWGMAEDDFQDRAFRGLAAELKRRGMDPANDAQRALVGLTNAGADGVYGVTIGRRLMLDDKGLPVTIDLRRGAPTARGYIERPQ